MKIPSLSLLFTSLGLTAPAFGQATLYELPDTIPTSTTADGSVVVGDVLSSGEYFEWTVSGGVVGIGGVTGGAGAGGQVSISDDGTRVGGTELNTGTGLFDISLYDRGTGVWTSLGNVGGSSGGSTGSGWGISGDGNHVVGLGWITAGSAHAVQWTDGTGLFDLGSTVAGQSSRANAVDQDGDVVVGWQDTNTGARQAAVWDNGVQTLLTAGGSPLAEAGAVSADGQWVVGIGDIGTGDQAWRWSQGTGTLALGDLGIGGLAPRGFATDLTGDGSTIIGFDRGITPIPTDGEGWIWTQAGGLVSLDDMFAAQGIVATNGLRFSLPLAISADGTTIAGAGRTDSSFFMGWVVSLGDPACVSFCSSLPNATGSSATLTCSGVPSSSLVLTSSAVPNTTGQFFYGPMALGGAGTLGDGVRCVGGLLTRMLPFVTAGGMGQPANTASLTVNYTAPYASGLTGTKHFQYWFRSGLGTGTGSNSSDAISITF